MFELTSVQKSIEEMVEDSKKPGRESARNAINHVKKAWEIRDTDIEMSIFRAITGEEESATAVFHSLKRLGYDGANKLRHRNHTHKAALYFFLMAVSQELHILTQLQLDPRIVIEHDMETGRKQIKTRLTIMGPDNQEKHAFPIPPLNMYMERNGEIVDFSENLNKLATKKKAKDIHTLIKKSANRRNELLYASHQGIPQAQGDISRYIKIQKDKIFIQLGVFLIIDQCETKQLFAQQALDAFIKCVGQIRC